MPKWEYLKYWIWENPPIYSSFVPAEREWGPKGAWVVGPDGEKKEARTDEMAFLNSLGDNGWELTSSEFAKDALKTSAGAFSVITCRYYYFKRPRIEVSDGDDE